MNTQIPDLKSNGSSKIYRRESIGDLSPTKSKSLQYWRQQARKIFERDPRIELVECVVDGYKTHSQILRRGAKNSPDGTMVIVASTGGRYGRARREYKPSI